MRSRSVFVCYISRLQGEYCLGVVRGSLYCQTTESFLLFVGNACFESIYDANLEAKHLKPSPVRCLI